MPPGWSPADRPPAPSGPGTDLPRPGTDPRSGRAVPANSATVPFHRSAVTLTIRSPLPHRRSGGCRRPSLPGDHLHRHPLAAGLPAAPALGPALLHVTLVALMACSSSIELDASSTQPHGSSHPHLSRRVASSDIPPLSPRHLPALPPPHRPTALLPDGTSLTALATHPPEIPVRLPLASVLVVPR